MRNSILIFLFLLSYVLGQDEYSRWLPDRLYVHLDVDLEHDSSRNWQQAKSLPFLSECDPCTYRIAFPGLSLDNILELRLGKELDGGLVKKELETLGGIKLVERIPWVHNSYVPGDMDSTRDYYLPLIGAPEAWDSTRGDSNIFIAVVDNAIMVTHEELQNAIWQNPNEIPGDGIDNDRNGWVDDVAGWDVADENNDVSPSGRAFRHGTHIAGLIAAESDNEKGAVGLAHGCKILPVKVASDNGFADSYPLSDALRGVAYALVMRAPVVCMAWGGTDSLFAAHQLMERGRKQGAILVAAAGNGPGDTNPSTNDSTFEYPASYTAVVSVTATDALDVRAAFATANHKVELCAPGNLLYAPVPSSGLNSSYTRLRGSSQATAVASAAFGLLLSQRECLSRDAAIDVMKVSCSNISIQNPIDFPKLGAGRINIAAAIQALGSPQGAAPDWQALDSITCTGHIQLRYTGGGCPDSLMWKGPMGTIQTGRRPLFLIDSSGLYTFCLTVWQSGIADSVCNVQRFFLVDSIRLMPGDTTIRLGDSLLLEVNGPSGLYTWEPASMFRRSAVGAAIWAFPQDSSFVKVRLTAPGGCRLTDSILLGVMRPDAVADFGHEGIIIFPQPAIRGLYVRIPKQIAFSSLSLYDMQGKKVWSKQGSIRSGERIPLSGLPQGIYILTLEGNGVLFRKQVQVL